MAVTHFYTSVPIAQPQGSFFSTFWDSYMNVTSKMNMNLIERELEARSPAQLAEMLQDALDMQRRLAEAKADIHFAQQQGAYDLLDKAVTQVGQYKTEIERGRNELAIQDSKARTAVATGAMEIQAAKEQEARLDGRTRTAVGAFITKGRLTDENVVRAAVDALTGKGFEESDTALKRAAVAQEMYIQAEQAGDRASMQVISDAVGGDPVQQLTRLTEAVSAAERQRIMGEVVTERPAETSAFDLVGEARRSIGIGGSAPAQPQQYAPPVSQQYAPPADPNATWTLQPGATTLPSSSPPQPSAGLPPTQHGGLLGGLSVDLSYLDDMMADNQARVADLQERYDQAVAQQGSALVPKGARYNFMTQAPFQVTRSPRAGRVPRRELPQPPPTGRAWAKPEEAQLARSHEEFEALGPLEMGDVQDSSLVGGHDRSLFASRKEELAFLEAEIDQQLALMDSGQTADKELLHYASMRLGELTLGR